MRCYKCKSDDAKSFYKTKCVCHNCYLELKGKKDKKQDHKCIECGKIFHTFRKDAVYCTRRCWEKAKRKSNYDSLL